MLEDRELILVVADIVQQPQDEPRRDRAAADGNGPGDGHAQRIAAHARHQVLPAVHRFGQSGILRALADEVGAHGQHDVDGKVLRCGGFEQKLDEGDCLVARVFDAAVAPEPEQLFELIHDDEQVVVGRDMGKADGVRQPSSASSQRRVEQHARGGGELPIRSQDVGTGESGGQVPDGILPGLIIATRQFARACPMNPPWSAGIRPAADKGRFAAARRPDDRDEARGAQAPEQLVDLRFTAEEEMILLGFERTQTRKRIEPGL